MLAKSARNGASAYNGRIDLTMPFYLQLGLLLRRFGHTGPAPPARFWTLPQEPRAELRTDLEHIAQSIGCHGSNGAAAVSRAPAYHALAKLPPTRAFSSWHLMVPEASLQPRRSNMKKTNANGTLCWRLGDMHLCILPFAVGGKSGGAGRAMMNLVMLSFVRLPLVDTRKAR